MTSGKAITGFPAKTAYRKLLSGIMSAHDRAMRDVASAVDSILKRAYWEIGRMIVEVEQKGGGRAAYGERLLEELSKDLTDADRRGFSVTNLKNMRLVYNAFSIRQLTDELTWTHFVALSAIRDAKDRGVYFKRALKHHWSVDQLQEAIRPLLTVQGGKAGLPAPAGDAPVYRLAVKRGVPNLFRVIDPEHVPCDDKHFIVDCGFSIYRRIPLSGAVRPRPGEIIAAAGDYDSPMIRRLDGGESAPSALYTFPAEVVRIIDGDTIVVNVSCGFGVWSKQKLRLRKINAPEIQTAAGKRAKEFVQKALKPLPFVVVKTYSTDIYDRYLADVFYAAGSPDETDPAKVAAGGALLNQELINAGHAEVWRAIDPQELAFLN